MRIAATSDIIRHTTSLNGFVYDLEVVAIGGDRYVVAYGKGSTSDDGAGGTHFSAEIRTTTGRQAGATFDLAAVDGGGQKTLSIDARPGGGFVAGWHAQYLNAGNQYLTSLSNLDTVRLAQFGVNGKQIGTETVIELGGTIPNWAGVTAGYVEVLNVGQGAVVKPFVIGSVYGTIDNPNSTEGRAYIPAEPMVFPTGDVPGTQSYYQSVWRGDGTVTFAWQDVGNSSRALRGGTWDAQAGTFTGQWAIAITNAAYNGGPDTWEDYGYEVDVLTGGETVVVYRDNYRVQAQVFDAAGVDQTGAMTFSPFTGDEALSASLTSYAAVTALQDGGYAVAWVQGPYTGAGGASVPGGIYMRTYDASGAATGEGILVAGAADIGLVPTIYDIDLDQAADGAIIVGWNFIDANNPSLGGTSTRIIRVAETVSGLAGDDTLTATLAPEDFFGNGGNNTVDYINATSTLRASLLTGMGEGGFAAGDLYDGIQNLAGSRFRDNFTGDGGANRLTGRGGNDNLRGETGADQLFGGAGNDTLVGGAGNDTLNGGADRDTFVFGTGFGADRIADFDTAGEDSDRIDLRSVGQITGFADLTANHLSTIGNDVVITAGANSIRLVGVTAAQLTEDLFLF